MLSAYAALHEKQRIATENITDAEKDTDSEEDADLSPAALTTKRKQSPKPATLPSRKRRKGIKETRYLSRTTSASVEEVHHNPTRGYSPSDPTTTGFLHDVEMQDVDQTHPGQPLSSFSPSLGRNVFFDYASKPLKLFIVLKLSEYLSFVGAVSLTVLQGSISLFGSIIPASPIRHRVYAPKNYPTATMESIECPMSPGGNPMVPDFMKEFVTESDAVIEIDDLRSGIQGLYQVCPVHLANFEAPLDSGFNFKLREFFPLLRSNGHHIPFFVPPSWSSALAEAEAFDEGCMVAFVKGPKGSGKSMFARMLVNRLLLRHKFVAYLDCDPGQTEFTPPGMVSLHILIDPIYGPPFTHPRQPFRAHFVGSTTVRSSPRHYQQCISALVDVYCLDVKYNYGLDDPGPRSIDADDHQGIPLVINSFGWNKGLGVESIHHIESGVESTHIYTFDSSRQGGLGTTGEEDRLNAAKYFSLEQIRSSTMAHEHADKRSLMIMSYLHHHNETNKPSRWDTSLPLCAQPPWEVTLSDAIDRIILIGSGSDEVAASEVFRVLNGAIVALVALDPPQPDWMQGRNSTGLVPYTQGAMPPPPSGSNCVGLALVRGVRASSGTLHVLTPVPPERLAQARILVMGEVKLPIWGMLDHRADPKARDQIAGVKVGAVPFLHWSNASEQTPGSKKLRVRRNLMRKNQSLSHP